ncbi:MAG TPA: type II secretion system protein [Fimbriimonadaceae bacterium]|jgi:prepilin-type N-terminal cleavage/methylation domain-containing protein
MKRAFSLVELLIVLVIVAILAAILFPVLASAKRSAKATVGLSDLKNIGLAVQLYAKDFDDRLAYSEGNNCYHLAITRGLPCTGGISSEQVTAVPPINAALAKYGATEQIFQSPADAMSNTLLDEPGHQPTWYQETATPLYDGSSFEYTTVLGLAASHLTGFKDPSHTIVMDSLYLLGPDSVDTLQQALFADWHAKNLPHSVLSGYLDTSQAEAGTGAG